MTLEPVTEKERYLAAFEAFEKSGAGQDPSWARALRGAAMARFNETGFPTGRRGNEAWKYTDVSPIARTTFELASTPDPTALTSRDLERSSFDEPNWSRLVFVDGHYLPAHSSVSSLPASVFAASLAEAMSIRGDLVEGNLAHHAGYRDNPFTALNTGFIHDGTFLHIPDGTVIKDPIHLDFFSALQGPGTVSHPRVLILAGKDSKVTIVESYGGLSEGQYFTNAVTEVVVGAGAVVNYYRVQAQSKEAYHIATTQVVQDRDSTFTSVAVDVGGGLVRNNLHLLMEGEGSSCTLNGLYLVNGSQHTDNQVLIDHADSYTTSRELYKGVLDDQAHAVFHGSITVRRGTQKVDAQQADKNLLLSNQAKVDTKPAFWIYADDVKCSHGAACGSLDEVALFYLRSRGIGEEAARGLLVRGFMREVLRSIKSDPLQSRVEELALGKLQGR